MVDENKAVLVGRMDQIVTEVAFLMDKLCNDETASNNKTYNDVQEMLLEEVKKLKRERDRGIQRSHPNEIHEQRRRVRSKDEGPTQAELALEEAMKEIKRMKKKAKNTKKAKKKS